jgi:hypothetical protein
MAKKLLIAGAALVLTVSAQEQKQIERRVEVHVEGQGHGPGDVMFFRQDGPAPGGVIHEQRMEVISLGAGPVGRLVKGAPYAAESVTESVQVLADGNRITHKNTSNVYRDGEGRTRREMNWQPKMGGAAASEPIQSIMIEDPVAKVHYVLDTKSKTARKVTMPQMAAKPGDGKAPDVFIMRNSAPGGAMIQLKKLGENLKKESLGKRNIEGLLCEGTKSVLTIPAGEQGNERPIDVVTESWYSPELQVVVLSKTADPRSGETTYKLQSVRRGEPGRQLFEVPADYTVKEGGMTFERRVEKKM